MKWLRDLGTGIDGQTHDIVRWAAALGSLNAIGLAAWDVIGHAAHFDFQSYGIGFGAMLAGVGGALKLKETTEPKP